MTRWILMTMVVEALASGRLGADLSFAQTAPVSTKKGKKKSVISLQKVPGRWQSTPKPSDAAA